MLFLRRRKGIENLVEKKRISNGKEEHVTKGKEEKMKHLSDEVKWNVMSTIITFLIYAVSIILAVLALYFTNGPSNEDLIHGCQFMLALVVLVTIYVLATRGPRGF